MIDIEVNGAAVEAILATPPGGSGPGVLLFSDAFGLRPRIAEMASEIAGWGYVVLAPNVFYREGSVAHLSVAEDLADPDGRGWPSGPPDAVPRRWPRAPDSMAVAWSPMPPTHHTWRWRTRPPSSCSATPTATRR